jgi:hypothetical protein
VSIFSKTIRASLTRPAWVSASTYQNEHRLKVPSPPTMPSIPTPSGPAVAYRYTRLSEASSEPIRSRVDRKRGSVGPANFTSGMTSTEASSSWLPGCIT